MPLGLPAASEDGTESRSVNRAQSRIVLAATIVVESAWLHAALGVMFIVGGAESPLNWGGIVTALGLTAMVSRFALAGDPPSTAARSAGLLMGAAIIYVVIGSQVDGETVGLDLAWPWHAVYSANHARRDEYLFRAFWGGFTVLALWWRVVVTGMPVARLGGGR